MAEKTRPATTFVSDSRPSTPQLAISSTTTRVNRTGSWRYIGPGYHDRVAPCIVACPVGIDVEGYMAMLADGRIDEACELLLSENPMPAITGRVCNHPCESACNRATLDGAVAVHAVERMLGDRILSAPLPEPRAHARDEAIAIIGSGPAGLACAYHLSALGYAVQIFERAEKAGGLLRLGIPSYRLPRDILDRQIEHLESLGVAINCNVRVGRDIGWDELAERFAAIFVATGAHVGRSLGIADDEPAGVMQGLEFLMRANRGEHVAVGSQVVVVGGGNTAIDCARTALRLGAHATVLYRRTRAEMPAIAQEIDDALAEGVELIELAAPVAYDLAGDELRGIVCTRMTLGEPDESGRRRPVPSAAPPFTIAATTILTAIGEDVELAALPNAVADGSAIAVDEWGETRVKIVFAGGDAAGSERTVAHALGAGKRAAIGIDRFLATKRGDDGSRTIESLQPARRATPSMARWTASDPVMRTSPLEEVAGPDEINTAHFVPAPRRDDHHLPAGSAAMSFTEANLGLSPDEALSEASRCFNCGVCNGCELCMIYCADAAIRRVDASTGRFAIALEYCKGCGVCAEECPRGAISMTKEAT
jgi:NADPH-dependent glutamate synthase beta subunit-like oxidoreductase